MKIIMSNLHGILIFSGRTFYVRKRYMSYDFLQICCVTFYVVLERVYMELINYQNIRKKQAKLYSLKQI